MYGGHFFPMSLLHNYGVTMMIDVSHGEPCKLRAYTLLYILPIIKQTLCIVNNIIKVLRQPLHIIVFIN